MTDDSKRMLALAGFALAVSVFRWLRDGIPRLGTASGKAVARTTRSSAYLWFKRHLPIAAATYVLLLGLLISFGTLTPDAVLIGCPAVAIAVSYLLNHFHPQA
jgi:hypothetical protein